MDGAWFWLLGTEADRLWPKLLAAIERTAWADDERWATTRARRHNAESLIAELDALFATRTRDEWTAAFDCHDVWWAPVNTPADVVADPQAIAAGVFVDVPGGAAAEGHRSVASPISFDGLPITPGPVPALGEHTAEVLAEVRASAPS
jgi:crotonobetainyl-CoA:carnitine CoA-transferase CaiB-like acyl-CoA transferase